MRSTAVAFTAFAATLLFAACAAIQQQKHEAVRADEGEFKNLKVLPQTITHDELIATMRGFARALGTKCDHCHVENPAGSKERFDFATDTKKEKEMARQMIRMVKTVNTEYLSHMNPAGQNVQCMTCHRGKTVPELPPPPAPSGPSEQPPKS